MNKSTGLRGLTVLQNIILKNSDTESCELYFRVRKGRALSSEKGLNVQKGSRVSFLTYFNSFSAEKWKKHTGLESVFLQFSFSGKLKVSIRKLEGFTEVTLYEHILSGVDAVLEQLIDGSSFAGSIFFELEALEDTEILSGCFGTELSPKTGPVTAVSICTFRREEFVERNLNIFHDYIFKSIPGAFEVFISDNAGTLSSGLSSENVHIFRNINSGGAGGFTRCVLEVLKTEKPFSHILFMDDDVLIHPETFFRLNSFLSFAELPEKSCIGGSFLVLDEKTFHYEVGAVWTKGGAVPRKYKLDLKLASSISALAKDEDMHYNGWWFSCFPVSIFRNGENLPYPFFIKGDDIEFGLRNHLNVIALNGISVWHESLKKKYSDMTNYFFMRNDSIVSSVYVPGFSAFSLIIKFWKRFVIQASGFRYRSLDVLCEGFVHFLKGPEFLKNTDPEENTKHIRSIGYGLGTIPPVRETDDMLYSRERTAVGRLIPMVLTFNGQFPFTKKTGRTAYAAIQGNAITQLYGYDTIHYYDKESMLGFTVEKDRKRLMGLIRRGIGLSFRLIFSFRRLKKEYRKSFEEFTKRDFWETYLRLK